MDCGFCAKPLQKLGTRELLLVFRRAMLEEHRLLLVFLSDYEDLVCWLRDLLQRLKSEDLPRNLKATEEAIRVHDERKVLWDTYRLGRKLAMLTIHHGTVFGDGFFVCVP